LANIEKIKVMIVDDSAVFRGLWSRILKTHPNIEVVTAAIDGQSALDAAKNHEIDVILLDIEMPGLTGLQVLPLLLKEKPKAKVIMASSLTREGSSATLDALALGATDFLPKPKGIQDPKVIEDVSRDLIDKILALGKKSEPKKKSEPLAPSLKVKGFYPKLLVLGSSTGGPNALSVFFKSLKKVQVPILIVQHMPAEFTKMLSERLGKESGIPSKEAQEGEILQPRTIYVAPGDFHMQVVLNGTKQWVVKLNQEKPEHFCRPAVDQLFRSVAEFCQKDILAVILTGMGEDGKVGCQKIRERAGVVIAQDEATSVVWGMPGAVVKAGAADYVLPLDKIAAKVEELLNG
jgi:two-component system, chemotaxis family, protein-glutamate methylesterase/glutaminase